MDFMPFNSKGGDRIYKAEDWAWYFAAFISNGVMPNPDGGLQVIADEGLTVNVRPGFGFINGYAYRNHTNYALTLDVADGVLARIDRIVLRLDLAEREMLLAVLNGNPSASPVAKALTQDAETWEIALADVTVAAGATTLSQSAIHDTRSDKDLCGICAGIIDQIDLSEITAQFDKYFEEYQADIEAQYKIYLDSIQAAEGAYEAEFDEWFQSVKDQLSEDVAGHLQNEIEEAAAKEFNRYYGLIDKATLICKDAAGSTIEIVETDQTNSAEATTTFEKDAEGNTAKIITVVVPSTGTYKYTKTTEFEAQEDGGKLITESYERSVKA